MLLAVAALKLGGFAWNGPPCEHVWLYVILGVLEFLCGIACFSRRWSAYAVVGVSCAFMGASMQRVLPPVASTEDGRCERVMSPAMGGRTELNEAAPTYVGWLGSGDARR